MHRDPESRGTTVAHFKSAEQVERFAALVRETLGASSSAQVVPYTAGDFVIAVDPRHPYGEGQARASFPDLEVGYSLLLIWEGPFPPELQKFLVDEGLRRSATAGPFANLIQIPIQRGFWRPGEDPRIWDINCALLGHRVMGAHAADGMSMLKRLVGIQPSSPARDPGARPQS